MDSEPLPIRFSYLKALGKSPAHCKLAMDQDAGKLAAEPNATFVRGSALHHLVFDTKPVIPYQEGKPRRGEAWDYFKKCNPDAMIVTVSEYRDVIAMAEAVKKCELAQSLIGQGKGSAYEATLYGMIGKRMWRVTPDVCGVGFLVDLKSCEDAHPDRFHWAARRYAYHAQMAWYLDRAQQYGTAQGWKVLPESAFIVAVESKPPYPVTVLKLTDRAVELGRKQYSLWLERFLACEQSGEWPGYVQSVVDLDVPEDETDLVFESEGG